MTKGIIVPLLQNIFWPSDIVLPDNVSPSTSQHIIVLKSGVSYARGSVVVPEREVLHHPKA